VTLLWTILVCIAVLAAILTIVDIVRRHYPGRTTAAWIALVGILPFIGSVIYWATRKPTKEDADQAYLIEAERRRAAEHSRLDI
jgi:hypothetical protein